MLLSCHVPCNFDPVVSDSDHKVTNGCGDGF